MSRWNKARRGIPRPKLAIITPNCLKVERAIIFLRSHSVRALRPAINIVKEAEIRRNGENHWKDWRYGKKRITRKIPAVTRVEECTRAETGVGAAIAAGSHLEKGIWALLVIAAKVIERARKKFRFHIWVINQCPWFKVMAILIRSKTSPIRFVKAVIIPAARDLAFW